VKGSRPERGCKKEAYHRGWGRGTYFYRAARKKLRKVTGGGGYATETPGPDLLFSGLGKKRSESPFTLSFLIGGRPDL